MDARSSQNDQNSGVLNTLMVSVRRWMLMIIFLGLCFLAVWFYAKHRVHEEIRQHAETQLLEHYSPRGLGVSVGAARLIEGQAIVIRNVSIVDLKATAEDRQVVHIDEIYVACDAKLPNLISTMPQFGRTAVRRMTMRMSRNSEGEWNVNRLFPLPDFGPCTEPVTFEDSSIDVVHSADEPDRVVRIRDINVSVTTLVSDGAGEMPADQQSSAETEIQPIRFRGTFAGEHVEQVNIEGECDSNTGYWTIQGVAEDLRVSPQFRESLPRKFANELAMLNKLQGLMTLRFRLANLQQESEPFSFSISGKLSQGRVDDERLPYPLTNVSAYVHCDNRGIRIERAKALSGLTTVELRCQRDGFKENSPLSVRALAKQLVLDRRLAAVLPPQVRDAWTMFSPAGTIDLDVKLNFDGQEWQQDMTLHCFDVSFAYAAFPYRVRGCEGEIRCAGEQCIVDLRGLVSGQVARFKANLKNPGPNYTGKIDVTLDGPITLNEELISALQTKPQQVVRSFHPRGMVTFSGHFRRDDGQQSKVDQQVTFGLLNCAIQYDHFPYPIEQIRGTLQMKNGDWEFRHLEGFNDSGRVVLDGSMTRQADGDELLALTITGESIRLVDELRSALEPNSRKMWGDLRPRGVLDFLKIDIQHSALQQKLSLNLRAEKRPRKNQDQQSQDIEGSSITLYPVWFPYRMDDVTGVVQYRDGVVKLEKLAARHGKTRLTMDGTSSLSPDRWSVWLKQFTVRSLRPDHSLMAALPVSLGEKLAALNLGGMFTLQGAFRLAGGNGPKQPVVASWDVDVDVENGDLQCGIQLKDIRGGIRVTGDYNQNGVRSRGNLKIDSMSYNGIQLTQVNGPVWLDGFHVAFGRWAKPPLANEQAEPMTARVFGGKLSGDIQVALTPDARFDVQGLLAGADLAEISRDLSAPNSRKISGKASAEVRLTGNSRGTHTWRGGGRAKLFDADIYEVPVMLALLKILSVRRPDKTAFTTSDMDFRIHGSDIYFDRIDFNGDAISLRGNGEMNLDRRINLNFYTIVGRNEFYLPFISPVLRLASRQFLQIHVDGTLDKPNSPEREVLPGLNETLRQLFPELANGEPGERRTSAPSSEMNGRNRMVPSR